MRIILSSVAAFGLMLAGSAPGFAVDDLQANNPLANSNAFNTQNQFFGNLSTVDEPANVLNLRGIVPVQVMGSTAVIRATLPVVTLPTTPDFDHDTGLGDFNVFAAYLLDVGSPTVAFGVGPNLTAPTASSRSLGSGQWSAGVANVLFNFTSPKLQWGYLALWEASIAETFKSPDVNRGFFQPIAFYQLGNGWYLRSTAVWQYNFETDDYAMPLGLGMGRVIQTRFATLNAFFEPQYTVAQRGPGQPEWGAFFGLNMQFD